MKQFTRGVAIAICVAAAAASSGVAAASTTWRPQTLPAPQAPNGSLSAVSCPTAGPCLAVGYFIAPSGSQQALAEAGSGSSWALESPHVPAGATTSLLNAVSCVSEGCMTVGIYGTFGGEPHKGMAELWNGTRWRLTPVPVRPGVNTSYLNGVWCTSLTSCIAVGDYHSGSSFRSLVESWDGTRWRYHVSPVPSGAVSSVLNSVSCTASDDCVAVGSYYRTNAGSRQPLVERWNGARWTISPARTPTGTDTSWLSGVSCSSASACTAVGGSVTRNAAAPYATLAERWDGTRWRIQLTPIPAGGTNLVALGSVSCPTATTCIAVESPWKPGLALPLVELWDGTGWTLQSPQAPGQANVLDGISCSGADACTVVGQQQRWGLPQTLAESWTGAWTTETTPDPEGAASSYLLAASCPSEQACVAVGYDTYYSAKAPSDVDRAFAVRLTGSIWSIARPSNPSGFDQLTAVSCFSADACTAVGNSLAHGRSRGFATRWDGSSWSYEPVPFPPHSLASRLSGVSCTSLAACVAVGVNPYGTPVEALAEAWDGTRWSVQPTPDPPDSLGDGLAAVSCSAPDSCSAVGQNSPGRTGSAVLAESLYGGGWTIDPSPSPVAYPLSAIACPASNSCAAVGGNNQDGRGAPEAYAWNGSTWTTQSPASAPAGFTAVSCPTGTACIGVGSLCVASDSCPNSPVGNVFAELWDGTSWQLQPVPLPARYTDGSLGGVSCVTASDCTAVGDAHSSFTLSDNFQGANLRDTISLPIAEHYLAAAP